MPAAHRIRPTDLFTASEWATLSKRNDWIGLGLVVHAWAIVALAMAAAIWQPLLIPIAIMVIGARQLGLAVLMHEAAHGGLHSNKRINDWVGQWLCAAPVGAHLGNYRPYHLKHHKYAQQAEDPDLNLSAPFPVTRSSLRRKILRDLTGQTFLKQRANQFANAMGIGLRPGQGSANRMHGAREAVVPFVATNFILLAGLTLLGFWWAYFVLWLLPMATWNQLITRLRNIAEHAVVPDNADPMRHARTTLASPIEALLIAPYWVNYHCEHHMFMYLPCYRLGAAHRLLREKSITDRMEVRQGYLGVLRDASAKPVKLQPA
ncbi:MAG: fatty acid desaturase family protein [Pseudomonadota bacterium]